MTNIKKNINPFNIIIIVLSIVIITTIVIIMSLNNDEPEILNVDAPNIIFIGEKNYLKITSNKTIDISFKQGYISSNITHFEDNNPLISIAGIQNGNEEITIKSKELVKKVNILVCDKINLDDKTIDLVLGEKQEINFNLDDKCLEQYNINISDSNIADYQNGIISSKSVGTTTLTVSRLNEIHTYTINVKENIKNKKLEFDSLKTDFKIGDKYDIPLINKSYIHTCSANNDLILINTSNDGCSFEALKEGTTIITAIDSERTAQITINIKNPIVEIEKISFSSNAIRLTKRKTSETNLQIIPSNATDKTITYISYNPKIASISNGTIKAISEGTTTIEARTKNGKTATISVIVTGEKIIDKYESSTLKYWIEQPESTYVITNVWVEDAYSQFKTAITSPKNSNSPTPRIPQEAKTIMTNTINKYNYKTKGLVAVNASAMVSSSFGKKTPSSWFGTSQIPLIINNGEIIRDSSNEVIKTDESYIIYGLKKDGDLTYYKYTKGQTKEQINQNKQIVSTIKNDGVLYTFGFKPILLENGKIVTSENAPNIRQAICQVDKNNFILITNTSSNRQIGFTFKKLAEKFKSLNCKIALNLDGGGSTCEYYKDSTNNLKKVNTPYSGRQLSDMIYFVEK